MIDYQDLARHSKASQDHWEILQLMHIMAKAHPKVIVEIGVDKGHSMALWKQAFRPDILLGIDLTMQSFAESNDDFHNAIIVGDSHLDSTKDELIHRLEGARIDFLFIDGDHTFDGVWRDFEMYSELVNEGGIIAFHDIMRTDPKWVGHVEVRRVFDDIKKDYPSIEIWNGEIGEGAPGIGVIFL